MLENNAAGNFDSDRQNGRKYRRRTSGAVKNADSEDDDDDDEEDS